MGALRLMWAATAARTSGRVPSPLSSLLRHYASAAAPQPRANFVAGQPTWQTHPEMLGPSELLPGMKASEFAQRRDRLAGSMGPNALAILPSSATTYMAGVIPFPFRQDPDFMYLTGINQHAVAALETGSGAPGVPGSCKLTLFLEPPSADRARWVGAGLDKAAAVQAFGAHEVYYTPEIKRVVEQLASSAAVVYFDRDRLNSFMFKAAADGLGAGLFRKREAPLRPLLHEMRLTKSPAEAALMRRSAQVAAHAMRRCMEATRPGVTEYQLAATFEHEVKMSGASRLAYPPVVAAGADACTIHYGRNDKTARDGQLLLMDAGCEYHNYVSDVTRTWPVGGRFSGPQRDVYGIVYEAHQRCLAACRPGATVRQLHQMSTQIISEGLRDLRVLPGVPLQSIMADHYRQFYFHSLSHWLGLDTHDTHLIGHDRQLAPGCVITIEPGLYIPDDERFGALRGIGVRIEDDVLVTEGGCEVLSRDVPATIDEVEQLVWSGLAGAVSAPLAAEAQAAAVGDARVR